VSFHAALRLRLKRIDPDVQVRRPAPPVEQKFAVALYLNRWMLQHRLRVATGLAQVLRFSRDKLDDVVAAIRVWTSHVDPKLLVEFLSGIHRPNLPFTAKGP